MDIPVAILFGVAIIWLVLQDWVVSIGPPIPRRIPTISAVIIVLIIMVDWFFGHRGILGHPGSLFHTLFKLAMGFLLVICVGSGLTAIRASKNIPAALLNAVWSAGLVAIVLKFMGVW